MATFKKDILNTKSKIKVLREELKEKAKLFFKEESQKLFDENPDLEMFSWTQYTPYYCDGETCEFSSNTDYPTVNWLDQNSGEFSDEDQAIKKFGEEADYEELSEKFEPLIKKVEKFLSQFDDADLEDMFGDHAEVIVTKKGVEIETYDHD